MEYKDLREWLDRVDEMNELKVVEGVEWDLELGAVTDLVAKNRGTRWAALFDKIKGYPDGYRVLTGILNSTRRLALTVGLPTSLDDLSFVEEWRQLLKNLKPVPPRVVDDGPVMENVHLGDDVNVLEFPAPRWHELDGGRYIGTGSATVTRDPDTGWINFGTYRVMVHDGKSLAFFVSPGKDGRIHRDKYFSRNEPCPVAVVIGEDPLVFLASIMPITHTKGGFESEYDWVGGVRGEPVEVIRLRETGLLVPANAEIVLEGVAYPNNFKTEGPFGEWTGYYASHHRPEPVIDIKAVYHRNSPIICGAMPSRMPSDFTAAYEMVRAGQIWNELEAAGVPDIRGVACYQHRFITVVSIKQRYPGHAKQAALLAAQCHAGVYLGRYVVVVDEDINPYNFDDVLWAMATRVDPRKDIETVTQCWSGPLDPVIPVEEKGFNSRAVIDATKPYSWIDRFPPSIVTEESLKKKVISKWEGLFS